VPRARAGWLVSRVAVSLALDYLDSKPISGASPYLHLIAFNCMFSFRSSQSECSRSVLIQPFNVSGTHTRNERARVAYRHSSCKELILGCDISATGVTSKTQNARSNFDGLG